STGMLAMLTLQCLPMLASTGMLAMLTKFLFNPNYPTAVILAEHRTDCDFIHIVPDDSTVEYARRSPNTQPLRQVRHARKESRTQMISTFTYPEGDVRTTPSSLVRAASDRVIRLMEAASSSKNVDSELRDVTFLVQDMRTLCHPSLSSLFVR
ncbi:hypothetical protein C8Q73DRAFT_679705, partial [Cubamyces lactineus]